MKLVEQLLPYFGALALGVGLGYLIFGTGGTRQTGSDTTSTTITTPTVQGTVGGSGTLEISFWVDGDSVVFVSGKDTLRSALILPNKPVAHTIPDTDAYPDSIKIQTLLKALVERNEEIYRLTQTAYSDTQITIGEAQDTLQPSVTFIQHLEYAQGRFAYRYENPTFRAVMITNEVIIVPPFFSRLHIGTRTSFSFDGSGEPSYGAFAAIEIPFGKLGLTPEFGHSTDRKTHGSISLNFYPFR